MPDGLVLASYLAKCGLASRRACQEIIAAGRVSVNGAVTTALPTRVQPEDQITVDDRPVTLESHRYFVLNKPPGYTCTSSDPHADQRALDLLPKMPERLFSIGRLDQDSQGLLLFTNDGALSDALTHPRNQVEKTYLVQISGTLYSADLERMRHGIDDEGDRLFAKSARWRRRDQLELVLTQGRKREIRRMIRACGAHVQQLRRIQFGPITLADLPSGRCRELTTREVSQLKASMQKGSTPRGTA